MLENKNDNLFEDMSSQEKCMRDLAKCLSLLEVMSQTKYVQLKIRRGTK